MKLMRLIKGIFINICIICSIALIVVHILDWYNPFMDFAGHTMFIQYILIACSLCLGMFYMLTEA